MNPPVVIVGGGLSGLAAAWLLHRNKTEFVLIEARERLGGRVLTLPYAGGSFDLGPSWVWHGQTHVAGLLDHFGLSTYEQGGRGDLLHEFVDSSGSRSVQRDSNLKPMEHALRIKGGIGALVDALARDLPPDSVKLRTTVHGVTADAHGVVVEMRGSQSDTQVTAEHLALALPPRLAAKLVFEPALGHVPLRLLRSTPTWMAAQAKFFAFYSTPFWRNDGLSGDVFSRRGPLAEIHDASIGDDGPYALMAFVGVDAATRAELTETKLVAAATAQLGDLFGPQGAKPLGHHLMDWSRETFTATPADHAPPEQHGQYGGAPPVPDDWRPFLHFISSETSAEGNGLIEGALQRGFTFAHHVMGS